MNTSSPPIRLQCLVLGWDEGRLFPLCFGLAPRSRAADSSLPGRGDITVSSQSTPDSVEGREAAPLTHSTLKMEAICCSEMSARLYGVAPHVTVQFIHFCTTSSGRGLSRGRETPSTQTGCKHSCFRYFTQSLKASTSNWPARLAQSA
jgi:hypothetical protein